MKHDGIQQETSRSDHSCLLAIEKPDVREMLSYQKLVELSQNHDHSSHKSERALAESKAEVKELQELVYRQE